MTRSTRPARDASRCGSRAVVRARSSEPAVTSATTGSAAEASIEPERPPFQSSRPTLWLGPGG
ncbi:hypothetical protein CCO04_20070 [Pimelobacter sp. 30-1]|nr:hypothetical protein [Pimelobacter sp. 30-1]